MSPRRVAAYVVTGSLAYAATLIAMLPAPWIAHAIERASGQTFVLRDPAGTVWSGSGHLFVRHRSGELLDLGALRWNSFALETLAGRLVADLVLGKSANPMRLELSPASATVRGLALALPGQILESMAPSLGALGPQGTILLRSDNLRIDARSILGLAEVEWRPVQLARAQGLELGSHVARLRGGGEKVDIEFGTIGGPLRLSGGGTWTRDGGLSVSGAVEHGGDPSGTMTQFLRAVCNEYRPGNCTFRIMHRPAKGA